MKQIKQIISLGNSSAVTISKNIMKTINLKVGDYVEVDIEKIEIENLAQYECNLCSCVFTVEEGQEIECPSCENENKENFTLLDRDTQ